MNIQLNLSYYASIMLNAFRDLLCSILCWHDSPGPTGLANKREYETVKIAIVVCKTLRNGHHQ